MSPIVLSAGERRPSLAEVLPNCLAAIRGERGSMELPPVRGAVVMLVDGLGAELLRARAGHARHLVRGWAKRETGFAFPSTTVAGITSLTTATRAGEHGLVGYSVFDRAAGTYRNQLSGWGEGMEPATWQLRPTVFEQLVADRSAIEPFVVSVETYRDSGLTAASLRGATYVGGDTMRERVELTAKISADRAHPLVYLYHAELDQAGHKYGSESDQWLARLEELDAAFAHLLALLPADIGVLVVADHGMLDIREHEQVDLEGELLDDLVALAGEPRLRHLYLREQSADLLADVLARYRAAEGHRAEVLSRKEAIAAGWYGPVVVPEAAERIGDIVLAARKRVTYYTAHFDAKVRSVIGQHGSITDTETIVPLIRHGAFAR
ncbi:alkaline phosphatase family protein [Gulosibacter macacae]|uniref:Alkaline phosphatase family protein n=1 Tax=Gulosibacter macacae TaxID=2488791 RepID=A0A3P3W326_9MICO|nr:alkaline phosphatase family protein [Gulosibacter macacae]RRJ88827.1 alkaline phosphatase family protein [Gulosibacter macacae]